MKKVFSLLALLALNCFTIISLFGQPTEERKLGFKALAGLASDDSPKSNSKFRFNEIKLDATGIEKDAQLIKLKFDQKKGIIRLQETELVEDDAPAAGLPEGYKTYTKGPVEWVED
ncbi:MAG: hypothetical protein K9G42_11305, partial [Pedobacter sp.]|nr:hypothetical protein [Pedobacter sp.]